MENNSGGGSSAGRSHLTALWFTLIYLALLLIIGCVYLCVPRFSAHVPSSFGPVPVGVPWYGALGAVIISFQGVVSHKGDWNKTFVWWHIASPLIGASLGIVSTLIVKIGILGTGAGIPQTAGSSAIAPNNLLYYLVAFLVGYREQTFRELIKRLTDVVFGPGGTADKKRQPQTDSDRDPQSTADNAAKVAPTDATKSL